MAMKAQRMADIHNNAAEASAKADAAEHGKNHQDGHPQAKPDQHLSRPQSPREIWLLYHAINPASRSGTGSSRPQPKLSLQTGS